MGCQMSPVPWTSPLLGERAAREGGAGGVPAQKETTLCEKTWRREGIQHRERQHVRGNLDQMD